MSDYQYDELEGFEEVKTFGGTFRKELITMSFAGRVMTLSKKAVEAMGYPDYVKFAANYETAKLLVTATNSDDPYAVRLTDKGYTVTYKNRIESVLLARIIEKMTNRALDMVNLSATGTVAKSRARSVIFDLGRLTVTKKQKKARKK